MIEVRGPDLVEITMQGSTFYLPGTTILMALRFAVYYDVEPPPSILPEQRALQHLLVRE